MIYGRKTERTRNTRRSQTLSNPVRMLLGALILLGFGLFLGCESGGAGNGDTDGDTTEPADPTEAEFTAAAKPLQNAEDGVRGSATISESDLHTITGETVVTAVSQAMQSYISFAEFVDRWDGGESFEYTDGGQTVTVDVEEGDNFWRLRYTLTGTDDTTVTYVYEMEKETDRWTYSWGEEVDEATNTLIEGDMVFGGRSGSFTVYDENNNYVRSWTLDWEAAAEEYHTTYTGKEYSDDSVERTATVTTAADGSSGEWSYDGPEGSESGSW